MRALLDESMNEHLAPLLLGHEVRTVGQMGWKGLRNGALLRQAAAGGFAALITADRSIEHQQNLGDLGLGVVVLVARSNRIEDRAPPMPQVLALLPTLRPGQVVRVGGRDQSSKNPRSSSAR